MIELNKIIHADCMDIRRDIPDKYFELAIVDPPYGINAGSMVMGKGKNKQWARNNMWDICPPDEKYFTEIMRVSVKQIIWGGNYFNLPLTGGWIFWDKERGKDVSFSDGELAWTNFLKVLKKVSIRYDGFIGKDATRIHPTQKPVSLYRWLLQNYAKTGDKIIDTHSGSGSCAIACHLEKFEFLAIEKDKDYYEASVKRLDEVRSQGVLF